MIGGAASWGVSKDGDYRQHKASAIAFFGSTEAFDAIRESDHFLPDESKVCNINIDDGLDDD